MTLTMGEPSMLRRFRRLAAWLGTEKEARPRGTRPLACEAMEPRTLMAAGVGSTIIVSEIGGAGSRFAVVISAGSVSELESAVSRFLSDLEAAYKPTAAPPSTDQVASLQTTLLNLVAMAGGEGTRAGDRVTNDLSAIVSVGEITPVSRMRLLDDLETLLLAAGVPGAAVVTAANDAIAKNEGAAAADLENTLNNPNALSTTRAQARGFGQATDPGPAVLGSNGATTAGALPEGGPLGRAFRTLLDDLKTILGKTQTVNPGQRAAVRNDFAAIAIVAAKPDVSLVSTLRADLDAFVRDGRLTNDGLEKLDRDLIAVLNGARVPLNLVDRTLKDLRPILAAPDLVPADLRTILGDLANLLSARPRATPRIGSWWIGGTPPGL